MNRVDCDFCGNNDVTLVHVLQDVRLHQPGQYDLVRCNQCGLFYINPQPNWEELKPHYPEDYHCFTVAIDDHPSAFERWAQRYGVRRRCQLIARRKSSGHLLDVGCSTGIFLNEMRRLGNWDVSGVEPVHSAADFVRKRYGIQVYIGFLIDTHLPDALFDVVTLWDVLEHTPNPSATLSEIYRILKPGGLVVLKSPDSSSWEARVFGSSWVGFEAPQHLFGFPSGTLVKRLYELGFTKCERTTLGSDYATFISSLSLWLEARGRSTLSKFFRGLSRSVITRVLFAPLFRILRMLGFRSSCIYYAYKPEPI